MSNENHNNTGNWKSKLEELDSLPGENMPDKNAAWEKLHERLRGKKRSTKAIWYWAAAACLLIALMIPWIFSGKIENNIAKNNILQTQIKESPVQKILPGKKDTIVAIPIISREKENIIKIENNNKNSIADTKKELLETNNQIADNNIISSVPVIDNPVVTIVAIVPVMKKLAVVHINELGDPVEVSPDIANKRDVHSFQLKLATQEVYVNPSTAFNKTGFTILKTKSSPN